MQFTNIHSNITLDSKTNNKVIISLGSNLDSTVGDAEQTVREAIKRLRQLCCGSFAASSLYITSPIDCPPNTPDFVNAVVLMEIDGEYLPSSWLAQLQALEIELGRLKSAVKNAPRALDLDLISFGERQQSAPDLTLPHPRATSRRFVLGPLAELEPQLRLPGYSSTVEELLAQLPPDQIVAPIK